MADVAFSTIAPRSREEVADAVRWALSTKEPLEVIGGGTKRAVTEPTQTAWALDLSALAGIVTYEPEELVLTVRPGTPLAEIDEAMGAAGQVLAFEPPRLGALLGSGGAPTFGGTFGSNLAGSRRVSAGAVRDHMLGLEAVSGRGEIFKAGGKVVKNVTGYDLARALAGSWGTLAVATELTVKTMPRPETEATLAVPGLEPRPAVAALSRALGAPAEVSAAAHLPPGIAAGPHDGATALTLVRLEGFGPSVTARAELLQGLLPGATVLPADASRPLWQAIRDVEPFIGTDGAVWRISVAPTAGPAVAEAAPPGSRLYFDWGGGLLWVETPATGDAGAATLRAAVAANGGGHATLLRAPMDIRAAVPTFHPPADGLGKLGERLRIGFDPGGILNPRRMARA